MLPTLPDLPTAVGPDPAPRADNRKTDSQPAGPPPSAGVRGVNTRAGGYSTRPAPAAPVRDRGALPLDGYLDMTVPAIIELIDTLPLEQVEAVREYEWRHRRRKTLLVKLERFLRDVRAAAGVRL